MAQKKKATKRKAVKRAKTAKTRKPKMRKPMEKARQETNGDKGRMERQPDRENPMWSERRERAPEPMMPGEPRTPQPMPAGPQEAEDEEPW